MSSIANNPQLRSWVSVSGDSDFPIQNLPFGICRLSTGSYTAASAIGDFVINLSALHEMGAFSKLSVDESMLTAKTLNALFAQGNGLISDLRDVISAVLETETGKEYEDKATRFLIHRDDAEMCMPVEVGDYTDFYSSVEHATNVGIMFRDPENALLPNWKHLPVGYHGRASSIIVSGEPVRRPKGQVVPAGEEQPVYAPSKLLDFELEMAFVIGKPTQLGEQIHTGTAEDHIVGLCLFNDWSARDIQKWEYVPLGPFLGKNFASTISPWIITLDALQGARVEGPVQEPEVLPYLQFEGARNFDIDLKVQIQPKSGKAHTVSRSNFKYMYWNICQQLAHHTVNGCNVRAGDMMASGTISGKDPSSYGSMLELSWRGSKPIEMPDGSQRKFILDGDTVIMKAHVVRDGVRIGFGDCKAEILPAH